MHGSSAFMLVFIHYVFMANLWEKKKKNEIWSDLNQAACPYFNMSENDVKKWLEPDWIKLDFMFFYIILPKSDESLNTALDCKATLGVTYTLAFKYAVGGGGGISRV